jgi:beta-1,4-mannosyl-glycoprotein beta-1,4-N-acetylglucosaminyltransferase
MMLRVSPLGRNRLCASLFQYSRYRSIRISLGFLCIFLCFYNSGKHYFSSQASEAHSITSSSIEFERTHQLNRNGFLDLPDAKQLCSAHRWNPYKKREERRKVYDLFMINDELDWLEIRLRTLYSSVDYFVILESNVTFTKLLKPIILKEQLGTPRFKEWADKIIYKQVENMPMDAKRTWDLEDWQRNAMFTQTFPSFVGTEKEAKMGDVVLVSDVDEVPRPATIMVLRECDIPRRVTIRSQFYYYGFQFLHVGPQWAHPQATTFQGIEGTILPADLRNGEGGNRLTAWWEKSDLWNAGWHCSTCFETVEEVLIKMKSFSHTGLNHEFFRDKNRIVDKVRKGLDLWDRKGEFYRKIEGPLEDVPQCLKSDRKRWNYLLDRMGINGGFKDFGQGGTNNGVERSLGS